jgi:hypothetical protein
MAEKRARIHTVMDRLRGSEGKEVLSAQLSVLRLETCDHRALRTEN